MQASALNDDPVNRKFHDHEYTRHKYRIWAMKPAIDDSLPYVLFEHYFIIVL